MPLKRLSEYITEAAEDFILTVYTVTAGSAATVAIVLIAAVAAIYVTVAAVFIVKTQNYPPETVGGIFLRRPFICILRCVFLKT